MLYNSWFIEERLISLRMHLDRMPPVFHGREISVPRNTSHAGYTTYIPETSCLLPSNYPWHFDQERTGRLHLGDFNRMPFQWSGQCAVPHNGTSTITTADAPSCESNENSVVISCLRVLDIQAKPQLPHWLSITDVSVSNEQFFSESRNIDGFFKGIYSHLRSCYFSQR